MKQENSNEYGAWDAEAFARLDQMDSDKWVVHKPEGAPYAGIRTKDGRTIAGTSSGLSEEHAQEICANQQNREYIKVLLKKIAGLQNQLKSLQLTEQEVAEIAARHGTINDFGKTLFTDSEMFDFVYEVMETNERLHSSIRKAQMLDASESRGVEWQP